MVLPLMTQHLKLSMKDARRRNTGFYLIALLMFLFLALSPMQPWRGVANSITQGYATDEILLAGTVVRLDGEDSNKVVSASSDEQSNVLGVVINSNDSPITITDDSSGVFVVSSGRFEVLVSSANGSLSSGDPVSLSPTRGVAMRADDAQSYLLGTALESVDFSESSNILSTAPLVESDGTTINIGISKVLVELGLRPNPNYKDSDGVPEFLKELSSKVAGKQVASSRIYAGVAVAVLTILVAAVLLYGAIRNSIVAIGRNPLSRKSVLAGLTQVVIMSMIVFICGMLAVYLVLKL